MIWDYAKFYNAPNSYLYKQAEIMEGVTEAEIAKLCLIIGLKRNVGEERNSQDKKRNVKLLLKCTN